MSLNTFLEKKFSALAFPGLIRAIVLIQCVVFAVILINPEIAQFFTVTAEGLANGEYWRLIAWVFFPFVSPQGSLGPLISTVFMYIVLRIFFMINDALEDAWGTVRTSFFIYGTILCQITVLFFFPMPGLSSELLYLSLFFAFATLFPNYEFYLFFILPVKISILAAFFAIMLLLQGIANPFFLLVILASFFPYLYWAVPRLFKWSKTRSQVNARRINFQGKKKSTDQIALHTCIVCERTEHSNPELDFRVAPNGNEYCLDHLNDDPQAPNP